MNNSNATFLPPKKASEILGVHPRTLYQWEKKGWIETVRSPGIGKRFYNVNKYLLENNIDSNVSNMPDINIPLDGSRIKILYIRANTKDYINNTRVKELREKYKDHYFIMDIASPVSTNLPGIKIILKLAIMGRVDKLVIPNNSFYFGFDIIESSISEFSHGDIEYETPISNDLVSDIALVMQHFSSKLHNLN
jgi:putative resolvase